MRVLHTSGEASAIAHVHINTAYLAIAALKKAELITVLEEKGKSSGQERYRVSLRKSEDITVLRRSQKEIAKSTSTNGTKNKRTPRG